jgi:hypothetical protein
MDCEKCNKGGIMIFEPGDVVRHKTLGLGRVRQMDTRLHPGTDVTFCYFSPEERLPNHAETLLVDVESLEKINGES